ncbi:MATE family efflux transporter [Candidatus Pantoea carbekii]|uniref:MATE family efflux transporter n=1 Tax=Candidatus Pantoea carbekii TaxID=1235990 RepID=UPI0006187ACE|nr:MATE family efflux transporter [Candidatus Pantoea carbekii]AKC32093.1 multidrug resistance protein MdtK [Candidatus Pantoea carbekii]
MQKYLIEARQLLILAIPVTLAQVSQTAMGFVDTIMSGAVSAMDMAAVAIGTSIWLPAILFGHGLLLSLTPIIAQLDGSGRREFIGQHILQGYWLALGVALFIMVVLWKASSFIHIISHIDQQLALKAKNYLHALLWGTPGYLFFQVARNQCEGLSKTKPAMLLGFLGLLLNIPFNYIFIYGYFGMPAMGSMGCGVATASVYWMMFIIMRFWVGNMTDMHDVNMKILFFKAIPSRVILSRLCTVGLPIALSLFFEVTLFAVVALLVSPLGIVKVAGHQIALNFSSLVFVLPLSLGVATTIRVGYCLGQGSVEKARIVSWTGQTVGITLASITAFCTVVFRYKIAALYTMNPEVVMLSSQLMLLAAIYQLSDSIQVIGSGILRGYKDTRSIFFITFIAYWLLGLPIGYVLALTNWVIPKLGPTGFWYGFIIALTSAAVMILWRIRYVQRLPDQLILLLASR